MQENLYNLWNAAACN